VRRLGPGGFSDSRCRQVRLGGDNPGLGLILVVGLVLVSIVVTVVAVTVVVIGSVVIAIVTVAVFTVTIVTVTIVTVTIVTVTIVTVAVLAVVVTMLAWLGRRRGRSWSGRDESAGVCLRRAVVSGGTGCAAEVRSQHHDDRRNDEAEYSSLELLHEGFLS
jgi:hypothetical protein